MTAGPVDAKTGSGPFDPIQQQFGIYLRGSDDMPRLSPAPPHVVDMTLSLTPQHVSTGEAFSCEVTVHNRTDVTLRSVGSSAVHLSYHWSDISGAFVVHDGERSRLIPDLPGGQSKTYEVLVIAPSRPGQYCLTVVPVQEQVAWFDSWDARNSAKCVITVDELSAVTVSCGVAITS
jgi:hypothetical protein